MDINDLGKAAKFTVKEHFLPKLTNLNKAQKLDLIYMWTKSGVISKKVFHYLILTQLGD